MAFASSKARLPKRRSWIVSRAPNIGGPGGTLDLRNLSPELAQYTGKPWGELPGQIKQKIIQEMQAKYGADYARNIKLYFEQLAERK